jgi:hypothetical protein
MEIADIGVASSPKVLFLPNLQLRRQKDGFPATENNNGKSNSL